MSIGWIAVALLFFILAVAFWCEQSEEIKKRLFSFFFESTEDTIVTCPSCNIQGVRPLPCQCAETSAKATAPDVPLEERLRQKYFG
jgi:hypothetical protein